MNKTRILSIDPGSKTGYAVIDKIEVENQSGLASAKIWDLVATGVIEFKPVTECKSKGRLATDGTLDYYAQVTALYKTYQPSFVVIESAFMGEFVNTIISLVQKLTIIKLAIRLEYPEALIIDVSPSEWRKALGVKEPKRKKGEPSIVKDLTRGVLAEIMGLSPPTLALAYTEHEIDAIGIAVSRV